MFRTSYAKAIDDKKTETGSKKAILFSIFLHMDSNIKALDIY
jgi:hypothetical protein